MKAIGIILAGGNNSRMQELSNKRAIVAMPIGGGYRSIDFALSNMSTSHIREIAETAFGEFMMEKTVPTTYDTEYAANHGTADTEKED